MSGIKMQDLPYNHDLDRETWVVSETANVTKAVRVGDIIDFVVSEARKDLSRPKKLKPTKPQPSKEEVLEHIKARIAARKANNKE